MTKFCLLLSAVFFTANSFIFERERERERKSYFQQIVMAVSKVQKILESESIFTVKLRWKKLTS